MAHRSGKAKLAPTIISIRQLRQLGGVSLGDDGKMRLGALTTHSDLESFKNIRDHYTALSDSARLVGSPATRHIGTLGGNLCNGSPAMESASPLLIFDAAVELSSARGTRIVPLSDFLVGPGRTARERTELLTAVAMPPMPASRAGSAYIRLEYRRAMEIAVVGAAAFLRLESNQVAEARVALTAVAPTCVRVPGIESELVGSEPSAEALARAARLAADAASPIDDVRASAKYRKHMIEVIVRRALESALSRATSAGVNSHEFRSPEH